MSQIIAFDPGIGQLVEDFNGYINDIYSQLMNFRSISQKRVKFRLVNDKIYSQLENTIAFYQGCLLWAYYIKKDTGEQVKDITGNVFLSLTSEQIKDYDYLMQVNFIESYFESYERDTLYYLGRKVEIPGIWKKILNLYKDFIELNKGFVNTRTTKDLLLPDELSPSSSLENIFETINKSIKNKNLKILFDINI